MARGKKGGCLPKFIIAFIVIGVIAFLFWPIDDEEAEASYDTTAMGQALSGAGLNNRDDLIDQFGDDVIRDYFVHPKGNGDDTVTVLVYMNGSNLESDDQEATTDLSEMVAGAGVSDKVNIVVQTMGTKKWDSKYGISSKKTERYKLDGNGLKLVDSSLGQLDCTKASTLADFLIWGRKNYPADRYMLVFWDHGGGAIYGFGYDEWVDDEDATLTIDEIQAAVKQSGLIFDFIGMDCCIMSSLEVCAALYNYCDYTILSEDFESGLGWYYKNWINALYKNTSISTKDLGKLICDDMVKANTSNSSEGSNSILALIDETMVKMLFATWKEFAYNATDTLTSKNFSRPILPKKNGRVHPVVENKYLTAKKSTRVGLLYDFFFGNDESSLSDYCEVDIMSAASSIDNKVSDVLKTAIANTLTYVAYSEGDSHLTGLAVSLPYGDRDGYNAMKKIFANVGIDNDYIKWLERFVSLENTEQYDYDDFDDEWSSWNGWNGWLDSDDDYDYDYDYDYSSDGWNFWDWLFGDDSWLWGDDDDDWSWDWEDDDYDWEDDDWGWNWGW